MLLKILAPVLPFITESIYKQLSGKDIHAEQFPEPLKVSKPKFSAPELMGLNGTVWKAKKDAGKSLKDPIKILAVPEKFKAIEQDLKLAHRAEKLEYGEAVKVEI